MPDSFYYVTAGHNIDETCFHNLSDINKFFKYLTKYCIIFDFQVHVYCLTEHNFHLILKRNITPSLSEFMRRLLTAYTVYYNRYYGRHGRLFKGPFKSYLVEMDQIPNVSRFIHLQPVPSHDFIFAEKHPGSSLRHFLKGFEPPFLKTSEILKRFKGRRKSYEKFMKEGLKRKNQIEIKNYRFIGSDEFVHNMKMQAGMIKIKTNDDQEKAEQILKNISRYFNLKSSEIIGNSWAGGIARKARSTMIIMLRDYLGWTYERIAEYTGFKGKSAVAYHINRYQSDIEVDEAARLITAIIQGK